MKSYDLNTKGAREIGASPRIAEKGAYVGKFTRAQAVTAQSGAEGIEFSFETDTGLRADYLSVWTHDSKGTELYGRKVLDAIMTCMKVRSITAEPTPWKGRDGATETIPQFRALLGRIGLFLVVEHYEKKDGTPASKMSLVMPFEADTERTASEVLDQAPAKSFEGILASLRDKPVQKRKPTATRSPMTASGTAFDDMDSDIPF